MKTKFQTGSKTFKSVADDRAQKQRAKDRKPVSQSQAGHVLGPDEAEKFFAKMFTAFCKELPQFSAPNSQVAMKRLEIHPDRANTFARRFLANRRIALYRKS